MGIRNARATTAARLGLIVALLAVSPALFAAEKPLVQIEGGIQGLEVQIKNASVRLKYVKSPATDSSSEFNRKRQQSVGQPFRECCAQNVTAMNEKLEVIVDAMQELHRRHTAAEEVVALNALSAMAESLQIVNKNLQTLAGANDRGYADKWLRMLGASVRDFREQTQAYAACCQQRPAAPQREKGKGKKKQAREADAS